MRVLRACLVVLAAAALMGAAAPRPAEWAQPIAREGVPNLFKVTDTLYRSAQPTAAGMKSVEALGVRTVINLRAFHSDAKEVEGTALLNEELSVKTWHLEDEDVVRVLRLLRDPARGPYLVHCQHGADRTGTMIAMYRMVVQGWPREKAIDELVNGGYGFHPVWRNILAYLGQVDVGKIRAAVGP
ncbi:MAG TPA: tyrosine-protein phosphatase [bacterium]